MLGVKNNIDLLDTLYSGDSGIPYIPDIPYVNNIDVQEEFLVTDAEQSPKIEYEILPAQEVFATTINLEEFDIRPRIFDNISKSWQLIDTGAQVSCVAPGPHDKPDPRIRLETADGSDLECYGKKSHTVRIGRKEFHIDAYISKTTDTIQWQ